MTPGWEIIHCEITLKNKYFKLFFAKNIWHNIFKITSGANMEKPRTKRFLEELRSTNCRFDKPQTYKTMIKLNCKHKYFGY